MKLRRHNPTEQRFVYLNHRRANPTTTMQQRLARSAFDVDGQLAQSTTVERFRRAQLEPQPTRPQRLLAERTNG
jgi:hypothetical protein